MRKYAPEYCRNFRCIAEECRHNCCIGWEIDIDDETLDYYMSLYGELGNRIRGNIITEKDGISHFCLGEDERCPFLNEKNLCDIYAELGEKGFCQICSDHPRFRNFYSDREEVGLGLCCEAAGRLILSRYHPVKLACMEDDGDELLWEEECDFLDLRDDIFDILQDRTKPFDRRIKEMLDMCDSSLPQKTAAQWAEVYLSLERMDNAWGTVLEELKTADEKSLNIPQSEELDIILEQLAVYFVYRHLADSLDDDRLAARAAFAALSCSIIYRLCAVQYNKNHDIVLDDIVEICRMYSSEVEYSDDNMERLLQMLSQ
ncbi:MAG: flagellin lysine-N-methylase [Oscillospiraceae bacterium]|nr:flagellin lysine-N-methylase [Oscillospiraceae bacterium]